MTPRFNARRRPNDRSSSRLVRSVLTTCSSQATMEHNVMGGPRRGVMSARWSMRPSTYDRMMRGSNQCRYYENSGYFNFGSVWLMRWSNRPFFSFTVQQFYFVRRIQRVVRSIFLDPGPSTPPTRDTRNQFVPSHRP